jgi:predicted dehydrogenase
MTTYRIHQKADMPKSARPIVILGAGSIIRDAHLPAYRKAGFSVAGIYDIRPEAAREKAAQFGVDTVYTSLEEAVNAAPAGAVFDIAVPAGAVLELVEALPDEAAVLIQKPMGRNLAEARQILGVCRSKRLKAAVNFQLRYAPFVIAARGLIDQGAIGDLHDLEMRLTCYTPWHLWPWLEEEDRVEIRYHSIHYIDLIRSFLGNPRGIQAKTVKHPAAMKLDSIRTNIIFDYGDVIRANITTNHGHNYGDRHQESYLKWEGSAGAIKIRLGLLLNYPDGVPDAFEYCTSADGSAEWTPVEIEGTWFPDAFIGSMSNLQRYAEGSAVDIPTSVEDAIHTMRAFEAAHAASDQGGVDPSAL